MKLFITISIVVILAIGLVASFEIIKRQREIQAVAVDSLEAEDSTLSGNASSASDSSASKGSYVVFGLSTPAPVSLFQPSFPNYATFYYPWYHSLTTDGGWSYWQDSGHAPPQNWFSNYLPDVYSDRFDPSTELYSSNDVNSFYWQLGKMAEARMEVSISSWWGQGHKTDETFGKIVNDYMTRVDNPYPNLRWAIYYEKEGVSLSGSTPNNPTTAEIVSDLKYLSSNYFSKNSYLKVNNTPVVFVYADSTDGCTTVERWKDAISQSGLGVYLVMKVFSGYANCASQPNSWHQYAPANRSGQHGSYSYYVSPGFWKDGESPRLSRNAADFETGVTNMVNAQTAWKLVETWNELGEGSGVEPADEVVQTKSGSAAQNSNPTQGQFKNTYIDILARHLPPLEAGTGR